MSQSNEMHTATVQLPTGVATAGTAGDIYVINRLGVHPVALELSNPPHL